MEIPITKTARKFGYIIWNSVNGVELERLLSSHERVRIILNGVDVGIKNIDRRYRRISVGYKYTRSLHDEENTYSISLGKDSLIVRTKNAEQ